MVIGRGLTGQTRGEWAEVWSLVKGFAAVKKRRSQEETLKIGGRSVPVKVRLNPRARRLIVKVHPSTGEVAVVAPSERSVHKALDFARQEGGWIADHLARVPRPVSLTPADTFLFKGELRVLRLRPDRRGAVWGDNDAPRPTIRI